jgi:hypothetical protein
MKTTFDVTSGKMVCSDPCYELGTWCQGVVDNVKNGKWDAGIATSDEGSWGERISHLWVYHIDAVAKNPKILREIEQFNGYQLAFDFGVDSGQFGFFDFANYRNDASAVGLDKYNFGNDFSMKESGDEWYRVCCNFTLGEHSWGVLPNGAVSSSGYGDGSYAVVGIKDDSGEWVAFCVEYIGQEEETDDWDDEDENND